MNLRVVNSIFRGGIAKPDVMRVSHRGSGGGRPPPPGDSENCRFGKIHLNVNKHNAKTSDDIIQFVETNQKIKNYKQQSGLASSPQYLISI